MHQNLQQFIKAEVRNRGYDLFQSGHVTIANSSDTQVQAYVKGSSNPKIRFVSESIGADMFVASCTCAKAKQGSFCAHIWAVLLKVDQVCPDFLDSKSKIELKEVIEKAMPKQSVGQIEYKKAMALKQKEWLKAKRNQLKAKKKLESNRDDNSSQMNSKKTGKYSANLSRKYPTMVLAALEYFSNNGFQIEDPYDEEMIKKAMKKLARVFHPDRGGTHQEALALNAHYEALVSYSQIQK